MKLKQKLAARRGETLTETLVAILVISLSAAVLAAMIGAASRMNRLAIQQDEANYAAISAAETGAGTATNGTVTITTVDGSSTNYHVKFYGGSGFVSYRKAGGTP